MRKIVAVSALAVVASSVALGGYLSTRSSGEAMTADLERDLRLATTVQPPRTAVVSAIEQGRNGAPSGNASGKRMVVPTRKRAPSPEPSPTVTEVAADPVEATEPAPSPAPTVSEPVATVASVPEPTVVAPAPEPSTTAAPGGGPSATPGGEGGSTSGDVGRTEGRRGSAMGGIVGVILRGGAAGHDNCQPASARRGGGMSPAIGVIGAIGGILVNGGMSGGNAPGGNAPRSGRRW